MYGEYDARTGIRWNVDPKPNSSISNYATFANNPIVYSDVLLDTIVRHTKGNKGVIVFGYGYEFDQTMKKAYDAAVKSDMSIVVADGLDEIATDFETMNNEFENVIFSQHGSFNDNGNSPTINLGLKAYNSDFLTEPRFSNQLNTIGRFIKKDGNVSLLGCFDGNDGCVYQGTDGRQLRVGSGLAPISVFSIGLGNVNVYANQGATPITSNMFSNGGNVLTSQPNANSVYYNLAKQFAGKWSMFNGYKFSSVGPIKIDENGKPIRVNSNMSTPSGIK